ncbi:MAG: RagB/SusD family nutrient uptake outer membrane protein [Muricauda sp.]|nr:RagB/SusD family nutrient uptake outer membrane protein [Allomuricauda sp.]MBA4745703.1 RagB/SusD family nutrient uptake outer membrane protein [Allomuricauda sp.]
MRKIKFLFFVLAVFGLSRSCTELDSEVYSEITPETFFQDDAQLSSAASSAYTTLYRWWEDMWLMDMPTDQSAMPIRSNRGWDDGGRWPAIVRHDFPPQDDIFNGAWSGYFGGVSSCNRLIEIFTENVGSDSPIVFELRALRAFYYYTLLDLFGNVPLETSFSDANPSPEQSSPEEVFAFIESELLEVIPGLSEDKGATYAKMNKWVAWTVLAKMYLNANNYNAGDHWVEAAEAANNVINSGAYQIEPFYFSNFMVDNEGSQENIFVVPYDKVNTGEQFAIIRRATHQSVTGTLDYPAGTSWGGVSIQEDFYNAFEENDKRRGMFFIGQQYTIEAGPTWSEEIGFFYQNPIDEYRLIDCSEDVDRFVGVLDQLPPEAADCNVNIVPEYWFTNDGRTGYENGARYAKWELETGPENTARQSNDYAIFRYAHILLIRAEALWRMNSGSAEALMLVNQVRERAGVDPLDILTEDDLFWEFKKELAMENHARTILIRYDRWLEPWFQKEQQDSSRNLYPIPLNQLNANPNLEQNPGYN